MRAWLPCIYAVYRSQYLLVCAKKKQAEHAQVAYFLLANTASANLLQLYSCSLAIKSMPLDVALNGGNVQRILPRLFGCRRSDQIIVVVVQPTVKRYLWHICCRIRYQFEIMRCVCGGEVYFFSQCTSSADKQKSLKISLLIIIFGA